MPISSLNVAGTITLGAIEFIDFEMPETVRYVPGQNVYIHKFVGGARHMDMLGLDYDVIKWEGTFLQRDTQAKIALLEQYVLEAGPLDLVFNTKHFTVVIKNVTFDHKGDRRCDYAIELYVLQDGEFANPDDADAAAAARQAQAAAGDIDGVA